jgi:predicted oxidoreductase
MMMSVTGRLCERIVSSPPMDWVRTRLAKARQLVLDGVSVAVAGARIEAAPRNATSMHVLDFEPMWTPATHALSPVWPSGPVRQCLTKVLP